MTTTETIRISDFDYPLPDERIAKFPLAQRDASKLLVYRSGDITETHFGSVGTILPKGAMLVFNNTKVIRARIIMHKPSGARIEIFCLEPHSPADYERAFAAKGTCEWCCIVGNLKKWKDGALEINFDIDGNSYCLQARRGEAVGKEHIIRFEWNADLSFGQLLELLGRIPIPPYLNRESEAIDNTRYQTVYSKFEGSVAAPTAGLHFSPELIEGLQADGFHFGEVTLHVGAGTFLPVKEDEVTMHTMHTEHFEITDETLQALIDNTGSVIPVGTTSVRTIESLSVLGYRVMQSGSPDSERAIGQWEAYDIPTDITGAELLGSLLGYMKANDIKKLKAATQIMIMPGYTFRVVNGIVTNFHQPKSTLLLLVSAFIGEDWKRVYNYALANDFRFLSYGDSSILLKGNYQP